jgi:hypothetical protein
LEAYKAGKLEPVPVELQPLPESATDAVRVIVEFFKLVDGVRRFAGMPPEVPFSCRWVAAKVDLPKSTVNRALRDLEAAGVLTRAGSLPGRGGKRGTHLWAPVPVRRLAVVPDENEARRAA